MTESNHSHHFHNLLIAEIVTPEASFNIEDAYMVVMPGSEGEFSVLPGHVSLLSTLEPGIVLIYNKKLQVINRFATAVGFVEVTEKSVIIFVEQACQMDIK